jgi:mxaA protein
MIKKYKTLVLIGLINLVCCFQVLAETSQVAPAQLNKSWGVLLGDVITMSVELPIPASDVDMSSIPHVDKRFGDWLSIRDIVINDSQLLIDFQLVNVAPETTEVLTPKLSFRSIDSAFIDIEQVPFTISPVIPKADKDSVSKLVLKPAHQPEMIDTNAIYQTLMLGVVSSALLLLVLVVWSVGWRPRNRLPFAEALHGLRMLRWQHNNDPQQAVRIVHKAFNRTANKTVVFSQLDQLFKAAPWLQPLEQQITSFYEVSSQHFFSQAGSEGHDIKQLKQLLKACRAKEKLA